MSSQSNQISLPQRSFHAYLESSPPIFIAGSMIGVAVAAMFILLLGAL